MRGLRKRNTPDIITWLRDQAIRASSDVLKRGMVRAADTLEKLEAENASLAAEMKKAAGCGACKSGRVNWLEEPCFSCQQDPNFPGWEWKGGDTHE